MIELRVLRQFLVLAQELHFGRAAQRLHMTQPPLTMAMQKLEAQLDLVLFERQPRDLRLTAAGRALLEYGQRVLQQAEQLPQQVQAAAQGRLGTLRLGFVSTVGYGSLPQWLRAYREQYPEVALQLQEATWDVQARAFERGELDAGFALHAPGAAPAGLARLPLGCEPMVLACAQQGALGPRPQLQTVLRQPLLIYPRQIAPSLYDSVLSYYRAHGATPVIAQEAIQMQTIVNLVSAGMGVAWVPRSVCALQRPGVRYWHGAEDAPQCETSLVWAEPAAPVVEQFVRLVQEPLRA
ncbi:LysR substrate-binding domain-containing protein [Roseateles sp. BYS180W]|uniref:LysR substrate-binding domain-containing protein n=1 Tax=Roseateles rivi TaxID=3299028 RepID=A0ABW7FUT2_9BURK